MSKIAVIGDRDSVLGFMAVGFDVFEVSTPRQASRTVDKLADDGYAIIFITQSYAEKIADKTEEYVSSMLPAIIPIPDKSGSGLGEANLKRAVERAVGADIIFRDGD